MKKHIALSIVVAVLGVIGASAADAYVLNPDGCKWSGTNPAIGYRFVDTTTPYESATAASDGAWDATSAPGYFYITWSTSDDDVIVYDNFYPGNGYLAWVSGGCASNDIWNDPLLFYWNQSYMDSKPFTEKKVVGVHELGHVYGLWHETDSSCNGGDTGLMYTYPLSSYSSCGWTSPTADDVAGVDAIY